jgi:cyclic pyranopterin phosphate synthase
MPEDGVQWIPHERILSYEDIFFLLSKLADIGVKKVRFTGGEPLVRKGMVQFLEKVCHSFPQLSVALTTNGSYLTQYAEPLARMRLTSVNISLDTLDAARFAELTRGAALQPVLDGIDALTLALSRSGGKTVVKINAVLMRGFNDNMVVELAKFALEKNIILRFIEFMPLSLKLWSEDSFVPFQEALAKLPGFAPLQEAGEERQAGPARYYANAVTGQRIGVISAVSRHFCASCNRLRVTSTGDVKPCLFAGERVSIAGAIRARDEEELKKRLAEAAAMKPQAGMTRPEEGNMYAIGG